MSEQGAGRRRLRKSELPRDPLGRLRPPGAPDALAYLKRLELSSAGEAFGRAVALFDEQRFFEAVKHFEYGWRADDVPADERPLWRALVQVAAGLCHIQRGNPKGAATVLARARSGLAPHAPCRAGVDVDALDDAVRDVLATLEAGDSAAVRYPPFPRTGAARA